MADNTNTILDIPKGFPFKITINEAVGVDKKYIAVLRLHKRKDGIIAYVSSDGVAVFTEEQTKTLKRGKKYDLEVWDSNKNAEGGLGHKLFTKDSVGKAKETYASMNGKTVSDFTYGS